MTTLVDGNNLLYAIPRLRGLMISKRHDSARSGLVELLSKLVKSGRIRAPVCAVFDGRASASVAGDARALGIEVRFAPHPDDADKVITDLIERGAPAGGFTVVTSDRELQACCRRLGAGIMSLWKFLREYVPEAGVGFRKGAGGKRGKGRGSRGRPGPGGGEQTDAPANATKRRGELPDYEVERWLGEFGLSDE